MFDQQSDLKMVEAVGPGAASANVTGSAVDRRGFEAVTLVAQKGGGAGVGSFKIQHSDTTSSGDFADVPAREIVGGSNALAFAAADTNETRKRGYIGTKRYVRAVYTHTANANIGALFILGRPHSGPVA